MISKFRKITLLMTSIAFTSNLLVGAGVTGIHSINNSTVDSDYKIKMESLEEVGDKLNSMTDIKEYFSYTNDKDTSGFEKEIAYLFENNIVTREGSIVVEGNDVNFNKGEVDLETKVPLSEFLMGLYKSKWGVIESAPLIIETESVRNINGREMAVIESDEYKPEGYEGNETSFTFDGDYHVYISPNVAELYVSEMLNKGLVTRDQLQGTSFLTEFNNIGVNNPLWYNESDLQVAPKSGKTVLGSSWNATSDGEKTTYERRTPSIFNTETITKMEALRYVAEVLKLTEREMTETEAKIVNYKYGVNYTSHLPSDDRAVVEYLIAMGILNFEDQAQLGDLYDTLKYHDAYDIFYRVSNEAGRYEFSKIQLTDSDDFWISKGFNSSEFSLIELEDDFVDILETKVEEITEQEVSFEDSDNLITEEQWNNRFKPVASRKVNYEITTLDGTNEDAKADTLDKSVDWELEMVDNETTTNQAFTKEDKSWKITRFFPIDSFYTYRGVDIKDLDSSTEDVVAVTENSSMKRYEVEFNIDARDAQTAVMILDSRTQASASDINEVTKLQTVTKLEADGTNTTLISAEALGSVSSDIQVIEDKVLMNKATGTMAVLLPDNGYALVGTEVIESDDVIVFTSGGEIYYNLEIIASLLTNMYMSTLDNGSAFITRTRSGFFNDDDYVNVVSSSGSIIDKTNTVVVKDVPAESTTTSTSKFYNVTLMQQGLNTLYKDVGDCTIVVDWSYIVPSDGAGSFANYNFNPTISQMTEFLYTKPEGDLGKWWDSNLILSNAIANYLYGTKNEEYIQCGYLAPTINILAKDQTTGEKFRTDFLNALYLPEDYLLQYTGVSDKSKLLGTEFNANTGSVNTYERLKHHRKIEINTKVPIPATSLENGSCYVDFLKLANGAVYRSINSDGRISEGEFEGDDAIFVQTRTNDVSTTALGKTVMFRGHQYYVAGVGGGTDDENDNFPKNMYYRLMETLPVAGSIMSLGNGKYTLKDNAIKNKVEDLYEITNDLANGMIWKPTDEMQMHYAEEGSHLQRNGYYLIDGEIYFLQTGSGERKKVSEQEIQSEIIDKNAKVYTYPVLWVHQSAVKYNSSTGVLEEQVSVPYLSSSNVLYSSLNRSLIDSIIANSTGVVSVNELDDGQSLMIGDVEYIKSGSQFKSKPATARAVIDSLIQGENTETSAAKIFTGLVLDYSGKAVPIVDYVDSVNVSTLPEDVDGDGTIINNNGQLMLQDGGSKKAFSAGSAKSVAIGVSFNDAVLCRSIGTDKYVLVQSTNSLSDGYLSDSPFFSEKLSFNISDDILAGLEKGKFAPISGYVDKMGEFMEQIKDWRQQDIQTTLRNVLILICWWFVIISWVAYVILKFGMGRMFLEMFRNPSRGSNRKGLDILQIASLGAYNLEMAYSPDNPDSIKINNIIVGSIVAMVIQYCLITFF